jgi:hypothetical protein
MTMMEKPFAIATGALSGIDTSWRKLRRARVRSPDRRGTIAFLDAAVRHARLGDSDRLDALRRLASLEP